jgi:hypothetical protein
MLDTHNSYIVLKYSQLVCYNIESSVCCIKYCYHIQYCPHLIVGFLGWGLDGQISEHTYQITQFKNHRPPSLRTIQNSKSSRQHYSNNNKTLQIFSKTIQNVRKTRTKLELEERVEEKDTNKF